MRVVFARLCFVLGTILLTTSLSAQTTADNKNKVNKKYIPYDEISSSSDGYQRRSAPVKRNINRKKIKENEGYVIKRVSTITNLTKKEIVVEQKDTLSLPLYSQAFTRKNTRKNEKKEIVGETLPNSYFQQNNTK